MKKYETVAPKLSCFNPNHRTCWMRARSFGSGVVRHIVCTTQLLSPVRLSVQKCHSSCSGPKSAALIEICPLGPNSEHLNRWALSLFPRPPRRGHMVQHDAGLMTRRDTTRYKILHGLCSWTHHELLLTCGMQVHFDTFCWRSPILLTTHEQDMEHLWRGGGCQDKKVSNK